MQGEGYTTRGATYRPYGWATVARRQALCSDVAFAYEGSGVTQNLRPVRIEGRAAGPFGVGADKEGLHVKAMRQTQLRYARLCCKGPLPVGMSYITPTEPAALVLLGNCDQRMGVPRKRAD